MLHTTASRATDLRIVFIDESCAWRSNRKANRESYSKSGGEDYLRSGDPAIGRSGDRNPSREINEIRISERQCLKSIRAHPFHQHNAVLRVLFPVAVCTLAERRVFRSLGVDVYQETYLIYEPGIAEHGWNCAVAENPQHFRSLGQAFAPGCVIRVLCIKAGCGLNVHPQ